MRDLATFFAEHRDEYLRFDRVQGAGRRSEVPDLCAMMLLASLMPIRDAKAQTRMLAAAERDEVWLSADPETVNETATDEHLMTLIRCGVSYDDDQDGFYFYV